MIQALIWFFDFSCYHHGLCSSELASWEEELVVAFFLSFSLLAGSEEGAGWLLPARSSVFDWLYRLTGFIWIESCAQDIPWFPPSALPSPFWFHTWGGGFMCILLISIPHSLSIYSSFPLISLLLSTNAVFSCLPMLFFSSQVLKILCIRENIHICLESSIFSLTHGLQIHPFSYG